MSNLGYTPTGTGLEKIEREAFKLVYAGLNESIAAVESAWDDADQDFAEFLGVSHTPVVVERVEPQNFYWGHRPSMVTAPIHRFPAISVMTWRARPGAQNRLDQLASYDTSLVLEMVVKSEIPDDNDYDSVVAAEALVNSRSKRMTDAANNVIFRNPTLGGALPGDGIGTEPTVTITDVIKRKAGEAASHGQPWLWQGSRIEYSLNHVGALSVGAGEAQGFAPAGLGIDQE